MPQPRRGGARARRSPGCAPAPAGRACGAQAAPGRELAGVPSGGSAARRVACAFHRDGRRSRRPGAGRRRLDGRLRRAPLGAASPRERDGQRPPPHARRCPARARDRRPPRSEAVVRGQARFRPRASLRRKRRVPAAGRGGGALPRSASGGLRLQASAAHGLALHHPERGARVSDAPAHADRPGIQRRALERRWSGIRARLRPRPARAPRAARRDRVALILPRQMPARRGGASPPGRSSPSRFDRFGGETVDYAPLGRTGLRVSRFCLGAMMFGSMGNTDRRECVRIVHRGLDAGINFVDTADVYSQGQSEEIVGEALRERRDSVVLATKFFGPMGEDPNRRGASRRWIVRAVEESLRRLRTEWIDLYQMHRFEEETDFEEPLSALDDLLRSGKIRAIGIPTFTADRIVEAQWIAERRGLARPRCEQSPYSILRREIERTVLPTCQRYGMGMIIWSPLEGGWLSGRYLAPEDFREGTRVVAFGRRFGGFDLGAPWNQRRLATVRRLDELAKKAGLPLSQIAVAWTLEHPGVTSAILGPRTFEQLEDLLGAADLRLDAQLLDEIDRLVPPGTNVNPFDPSSDPAALQPARRRRG